MNWFHFLSWVGGLYLAYYLANILIDVAGSGNAPADNSLTNELTFSETQEPQRLEHMTAPVKQVKVPDQTDLLSSGGVSLRDLFTLARQESIIYTRPVSF
jgi:hypothetical protein